MESGFTRGFVTGKRFSIDDAFEEENDDVVKVYGSTTERSPLKPKYRSATSDDSVIVCVHEPNQGLRTSRSQFADDTLSRDSDSLIHDGGYYNGFFDQSQACWHHPKVRENWKMVIAAVVLLIIGIGLLVTGIVVVFLPRTGPQGLVFFIAGFICFIPGIYHVVYIYLAVKGRSGCNFSCDDCPPPAKSATIAHGSLDFDGVSRWDDIRATYDLDKSSAEFCMLHKLKDSHLAPIGTQKMKVAKAAQVLSHSVAATIMYAVRLGSLPSSALATSTFVKLEFNICNARS